MPDRGCVTSRELREAVEALNVDLATRWWRPFQIRVTSACRGRGVQAQLYRRLKPRGAMVAPPGRSAHEYGMAVDVVPLTPLGWNDRRAYEVIHATAPKYGLVGIDLDRDPGHLQLRDWRARVREGARIYPRRP